MNVNKYLPTAGRILTPIAMVIFLAYGIVQSQPVDGLWKWAVLVGAIASASGFEIVGILSGSALEKSWRMENWTKTAVSFLLLALYTGAAMWILWANEAIRLLPLIAAIVYVVSSLSEGLDVEENEKQTAVSRQDEFSLAQAEKDADFERAERAKSSQRQADNDLTLSLSANEGETAVAIAAEKTKATIANAKARQAKALAHSEPNKPAKRTKQTSETNQTNQRNEPNSETNQTKGDMVQLELETNYDRTNVEIGEVVGTSGQYVGRIRNKMNGNGVTHA